jgi:hypothetical protein
MEKCRERPQEKGGELLGVEGSVEGKRYRAEN